jgi:hypothetical protein
VKVLHIAEILDESYQNAAQDTTPHPALSPEGRGDRTAARPSPPEGERAG